MNVKDLDAMKNALLLRDSDLRSSQVPLILIGLMSNEIFKIRISLTLRTQLFS